MGRRLSQSEHTIRQLQKSINGGIRFAKAVDRATRSSNRGRRRAQSSGSGCLLYLFAFAVVVALLTE